MPAIVSNIDPSTIDAAIEANINAYLLSFALLPGAVLHHDPQSIWADSGIASETFDSVGFTHFTPSELDPGLDSGVSHFRRRSLPVTRHVDHASKPAAPGRYCRP